MSQDDLVPDEALVTRLEHLANALTSLNEIVNMRKHLPGEAVSALAAQASTLVGEMRAAVEPDDEINAKYRSRMRDEYCITASGRRFYIFDPKADEVGHLDIVTGLANECRYSGQVPRFYSVAEHSIKVAAMTEQMVLDAVRDGTLSDDILPLACLHALMHDAHEAYTGDVPQPYKGRMSDVYGTPWERIEDAVQDAILSAYDIPPMPVEVEQIVRQADQWMLYAEVIALHGDSLDQFPSLRRMTMPSPSVLSVGTVRREEPERGLVRRLFDNEVRRLVSLIGGRIPGDIKDVRRVSRVEAAEAFAAATQQAGIPGDRDNPPPPTPMPERTPTLSRPPRSDDVTPGSWTQAVRSSSVETPPSMSRLLNDPDLTPEERARLQELGGK
jgi:hypothetical protein